MHLGSCCSLKPNHMALNSMSLSLQMLSASRWSPQTSRSPPPFMTMILRAFCVRRGRFVFATISTTILYCLVFFLSMVGNSLVLWVLVKHESLESLTNVFILNLCLSDLVFSPACCPCGSWGTTGLGAGRLPVQAPQHGLLCQPHSSISFLTIMTIHRYLSVVSPISSLRVHTLQRPCAGDRRRVGSQ